MVKLKETKAKKEKKEMKVPVETGPTSFLDVCCRSSLELGDLLELIERWRSEEPDASQPSLASRVEEYVEEFYARLQDACSQDAAHEQPGRSSLLGPAVDRLLLCLSDQQWRELSEGVYSEDVKQRLGNMWGDVSTFVSKSVVELMNSDALATAEESQRIRNLEEFYSRNLQRLIEGSFRRRGDEEEGGTEV